MSGEVHSAAPGEARKPSILVIDDVADNRLVVCRRLAKMGYAPIAADSAQMGLEIIHTSPPDLVLLDYMMPDKDGLAVLRELRADSRYAILPIIMLTARTDPETVVAVLDAGASDYISKPINFTVLQTRIEAQLQRAAQIKAHETTNEKEKMERQLPQSTLKSHALQARPASTISQHNIPSGQLPSGKALPESQILTGPLGQTSILGRLQRAELLTRRLIEQGAGLNLAVLLEIREHMQAALKELTHNSFQAGHPN